MKAIIMLGLKDGIIIEGDDLKIQANGMLNEFRIYDGNRCVFYTGLGNVHHARIEGEKMEDKE